LNFERLRREVIEEFRGRKTLVTEKLEDNRKRLVLDVPR